MLDPKALAETTAGIVRAMVERKLTPILERLAAVEARKPEPGLPGEPGKDGKDGEKGVDGLGFDDLSIDFDGDRTVTLKFQRGDAVKEFPLVLPILLDRGVYQDGSSYQRGDGVTFGGSLWVAQKDTSSKPGGENPDWRLAVKKGRDAKAKV